MRPGGLSISGRMRWREDKYGSCPLSTDVRMGAGAELDVQHQGGTGADVRLNGLMLIFYK